jgi:hypothetical protein
MLVVAIAGVPSGDLSRAPDTLARNFLVAFARIGFEISRSVVSACPGNSGKRF